MTTRALFSLSEDIMARFRELVPSRERSAFIGIARKTPSFRAGM